MLPRSLRGKFTLMVVGLALLALLVGTAGIWNLYRLERSVDNLMTANYKSIDAVYRMMEALERQDSGMLISMSVDRDIGLSLFTKNGAEFQNWFSVERSNVTEAGEREIISRIEQEYSVYQDTIFNLRDRMASEGTGSNIYYMETILPMVNAIKTDCKQLVAINERAMFAARQSAAESGKRSMLYLLAISLASAVFGYLVAMHFIKRFLAPIKQLSDSLGRIREGNLYQHVDVLSGDEAGILATEFNSMTKRLQDYERSNLGTLMAEKEKSLAIVRSISDPLLVLDAGWRILLVNDACARFFSLDLERVAGRHFLEVIPDGGLFAEIERLAGCADQMNRKVVVVRREEVTHFNLVVTRFDEPDIGSAGIIVALQNVTGFKQLEQARTDFLAAVSHEFKTPLTSILMAASLLREGGLGGLNPDQAESVDTIRDDGERLLELVDVLLELIRIESGKDLYHIAPCSIREIAEASVGDLRETADRRGVTLAGTIEAGIPAVSADFEKIRWVLNNLIGNAVKYSAEGSVVTVSAERRGGTVLVSVHDDGEGIPPEQQERIFDRFSQSKGGARAGGSGLGLSICKDIVAGHGGGITVESAVDEGSTFTFSLPAAENGGGQ